MDYDHYSAFFGRTPYNQGQFDRRMRDVEWIAPKHVEIEAMRVAKELAELEKANANQELMAATAAHLKEHRRRQQGERVEYQVSRVGHPMDKAGPLWK